MEAIEVEGLRQMMNLGDFRQAQAQIVVFDVFKFGVDTANAIVNGTAHQPKVEHHEIRQQSQGGIGDLAAFPDG